MSLRNNPRVQLIQPPRWDEAVCQALRGVAGVVHLAGLAHVRKRRETPRFHGTNVGLTARLVDAVKNTKNISLFINMSSLAAVTGNVSDVTVDDYTPPQPTTEYGLSKLDAEAKVAELSDLGIAAISLRPPVIVGSDAKGNWALLLRLAATGVPLPFKNVHNQRSLVSVQTVTEAINHLCCTQPSPATSGGYCLADPEPLSLRSMVSELRAGLGIAPRLLPVPPPILSALGNVAGGRHMTASLLGNLHVDGSRFYSVFNFPGSIGLRAAIRISAAEYQGSRPRKW